MGLTGYYRRFVKGYGIICKPLTQLLKKDAYKWNEEATAAFNQLKFMMTQPLVLALPDLTQQFIIETDANNKGMGAVLMQAGHSIAFISKAFGVKQQALSTYERELLAILLAVTKWRHYLWGQHFTIPLQDFTVLPTDIFRRCVIERSSVNYLPTILPTK